MESNELSIVIVTYKSEEIISTCLDSIPKNLQIFVVENSNNKDFKNKLESNYSNVKCILTGSNKGYAVANNIGLNSVKTRYALILNPDTKLDVDAIKNFYSAALNEKDFWLLGPANDQGIEYSFQSNRLLEVNNLKGFAIFFNLEKFKNSFFDENYFLYFEEIDLCKITKMAGGKIFLDKKIIINHEGSSSVSKSQNFELEKSRNWHWMWSTFYYHRKFKGYIIALFLILPKFLSAILKMVFYLLIFNNKKRSIYFCRMSGIINSMLGKKSWYRPSLD